MLEKYLNKNVVIEEKIFGDLCYSNIPDFKGIYSKYSIKGIITAIDDEFIEVDNKMLIARKFIYRIILK